MDEGAQNQRFREHLWQHLESEHRQLNKVLGDVESLAAEGSFETARKRFGEYRLAHERHLVTERKLEALFGEVRETAGFVTRLKRERTRMLEQSAPGVQPRGWKAKAVSPLPIAGFTEQSGLPSAVAAIAVSGSKERSF